MKFLPVMKTAAIAAISVAVTACSTREPAPEAERPAVTAKPSPTPEKKTENTTYWKGSGVAGASSITVDLSDQLAYYYKGGKLVGRAKVSTGREGHETPPGSYTVTSKHREHRSNLYGNYVSSDGTVLKKNVDVRKDKKPEGAEFKGASMPYFLRLRDGYGLHAGRVPSQPASHGCIRLPNSIARNFFEATPVGTPVSVRR